MLVESFKLASYITAQAVRRFTHDKKLLEQGRRLLNRLGVRKVYVENYRSGLLVDKDELVDIREILQDGFEVSGGTCIGTWGRGWGRRAGLSSKVICLNDERNLAMLTEVMAHAASVFNEVLIDDFWANWCYCDVCIERFNREYGLSLTPEELRRAVERSDPVIMAYWAEYSSRILEDVSRRFIVEPARRANADIKVVLKVAEWRESFYHRGLFFERLKNVFDGFYVGTESREGTLRYGAFYTASYVREFVGDMLLGAWFDTFNGYDFSLPINPETYVEQAWMSVLGPVDEVTLFHLGNLMDVSRRRHVKRLMKSMPEMMRVREALDGEPIGLLTLAVQQPQAPLYDRYLEDALGIIGVPLKPVKPSSVKNGDYVLLTEKDVRRVGLKLLLDRGANLVVTSAAALLLARGIAGPLGLEVLGLRGDHGVLHEVFDARMFIYGGRFFSEGHRRQYVAPVGPILDAEGVRPLLLASDGVQSYPVIYVNTYGGSRIYVLSVTKYAPYLVKHYPEPIREAVRDIAMEYLGFKLECVKQPITNLSVFPRMDGSIALINMNYYPLRLRLVVDMEKNRLNTSKPPTLTVLGKARIEQLAEKNNRAVLQLLLPAKTVDVLKPV